MTARKRKGRLLRLLSRFAPVLFIMSDNVQQVSIFLLGQELRIRVPAGDVARVETMAEDLGKRLSVLRNRPGQSDLRAALMAAYELAFVNADLEAEVRQFSEREQKLKESSSVLDRLLGRIDAELAAGDGDCKPRNEQLDFVDLGDEDPDESGSS